MTNPQPLPPGVHPYKNPDPLPLDSIDEDLHPDKTKACRLFGKRVQAPWPHKKDVTVDGLVVGYDPRPLKEKEGDWVIINDLATNEWVPVPFKTIKVMED